MPCCRTSSFASKSNSPRPVKFSFLRRSLPGLTGQPSIPEMLVLEPRGRGVLDAPLEAGHDNGASRRHRLALVLVTAQRRPYPLQIMLGPPPDPVTRVLEHHLLRLDPILTPPQLV